jgi:hypothetical protein
VIVRDTGEAWQVVMQTDHADLSGAIAAAWVDRGPRHDSVAVAARRHDDGWAVWERSPLVDGSGKPVSFLDVNVRAHLAFYRAGIAAIADEDPYAGLLVSMHGAGIYRQRYGEDPDLRLSQAAGVADLVDAFVDEQESSVPERAAAAGVDDEFRWADYRRLQAYDRLSLLFCLRDLASSEPFAIGDLRIEPTGPWSVRVDPFPLGSATTFRLLRRLVPKRPWSQEQFRASFPSLPVEPLEVTISP